MQLPRACVHLQVPGLKMTRDAIQPSSEMSSPEQQASGERTNRLVFRDGREQISGKEARENLERGLQEIETYPRDRLRRLDTLIFAGELESALADRNWPNASWFSELTDVLALVALGCQESFRKIHSFLQALGKIALPESLALSPPEGFAYYALHPIDFAMAVTEIAPSALPVAVVGIRNIGTTLSAIVVAALKLNGCDAQRITVRPEGHPYDRVTRFDERQANWVREQSRRAAHFYVVDEGPGLSGSSFLSVGEALIRTSIAPDKITFLGSRNPEVKLLCANQAATRWSRFRSHTVMPRVYPEIPKRNDFSAGEWRGHVLGSVSQWPACWPQMERLKFVSADGRWFLKFDGLGRFGEQVRGRAAVLADRGFGLNIEKMPEGLTRYPLLAAKAMKPADLCRSVLEHIAGYCAFRARRFPSADNPNDAIENMLRFNLSQEFGIELDSQLEELRTCDAIIADGRMQPWEWLRTSDNLVKVDGCSHGNDHFYPGPTNIAWDLAGAIIEWDMDRAAARYLVEHFRARSGDDPDKRLPAFLLAYSVFRVSYCLMALGALRGTGEETRMRRAYEYYREKARWLLLRDWLALA